MKKIILLFTLILLTYIVLLPTTETAYSVQAQSSQPCVPNSPCDMPIPDLKGTPVTPPNPADAPQDTGKHQSLRRWIEFIVTGVSAFFLYAESKLSEWFYIVGLVGIGLVTMISMMITGIKGIDKDINFGKWVIGVFIFASLFFVSGDIDGDGKPSDLVEYVRVAGIYIAYGADSPVAEHPNTMNPLPILVAQQSEYFHNGVKRMMEGVFTVKVDPNKLPITVKKPEITASGVMKVLFRDTHQIKDLENKSESDSIDTLFTMTILASYLLQIAEIFFFTTSAILASAFRITFPLMLMMCIHPPWRERYFGSYWEQVVTFCIVYPIVGQFARFLTYYFCNASIYSLRDEGYYIFDEKSMSIVQQEDPLMVVSLFTFMAIIMAIVLGLAVPALSWALVRGNILGFFSQSLSSVFSTALSTGLNYVTGKAMAERQFGIYEQRHKTDKEIADASAQREYLGNTDRNYLGYRQSVGNSEIERTTGLYSLDTTRAVTKAGNQMTQYSENVASGIQYDAQQTSAITKLGQSMSASQMKYAASSMGLSVEQMKTVLDHLPQIDDATARTLDKLPLVGTLGLGGIARSVSNLDGAITSAFEPDRNRLVEMAMESGLKGDQIGKYADATEQIWRGEMSNKEIDALGLNSSATTSLKTLNEARSFMGMFNNLDSDGKKNLAKMFVDPNGKFSTGNFTKSFAEAISKSPDGEKLLTKAGFSPEQIQMMRGIPVGNENMPVGNQGMVTAPTAPKLPKGIAIPKKNQWIPAVLNDEMMRLGYTPQGRLVYLGNVGRENSFDPNTIFNNHIDPASYTKGRGKIINSGIISWNAGRRDRLMQHLGSEGLLGKDGKIIQNEQTLRSMVRFAHGEMATGKWGNQLSMLQNPNASLPQVAKSMQKWILNQNKPGKYQTPQGSFTIVGDSEFNVRQNRVWAEKIAPLVEVTSNRGGGMMSAPVVASKAGFSPRSVPLSAGSVMQSPKSGVNYTPQNVPNGMPGVEQTYRQQLTDLSKMGSTYKEIYAPIYSKNLELQGRESIINMEKQWEQNTAKQTYANEAGQAMRQYETNISLSADKRNFSDAVADYSYDRGATSLNYVYGEKVKLAKDSFGTMQNIAERDFDVSMRQNQLRYDHAMWESREMMELDLMRNVLQNSERQVSDLFEKLNSRV